LSGAAPLARVRWTGTRGKEHAQSHVANGEWAEAWGPSGVAYHVASRPLLQGHDRSWLDEWRRRLDDVRLHGLECFATARLGLGGPTLPQAEECGRRLIALAPYRKTGYRILMEALEQRSNNAEALLVYDRLRVLLSDELGIAPSPAVQSVYRRLLGTTTTTTPSSAWATMSLRKTLPSRSGRSERRCSCAFSQSSSSSSPLTT
jgi:DNA-binding SARP family transcriptional activator